jgi:hypothetical protein
MSYFMRFFVADGPPPTLDDISAALQALDDKALLARDASEPNHGDLYYEDALYAEVELNDPGDDLFAEDRDELLDELGKQDAPGVDEAAAALRAATGAMVLRVYEPGHDDPARLNALIDWLFATRTGVLQVDEEGFFDRAGRRIVALL